MITCRFENGGNTSLRHVCVNGIIVRNNKILLGKRGTFKGKKMLEYGKWGLIGGFLERNEDMVACLKREALEESGWLIKNPWLLGINDNPNRPAEDRQNIDMIFIASAVKKIGSFDEEIKKLRWFAVDSLPKKKDTAFDHYNSLFLYKRYLENPFPTPIFIKGENI